MADEREELAALRRLAELEDREKASTPAAPEAPKRGFLEQAGRELVGGAEAAAQFGTGAIAAPLGGLAGVGQMVNRRLKLSDMHPGEAVRDVASRLTYSPRTPEGERTSSILNYPFEKIAEGADYFGGKATDIAGPAMGALANTSLQAIPAIFGKARTPVREMLKKSESDALSKNVRTAEHNETLNRAGAEGFVTPRFGSKRDTGVKFEAAATNVEKVYDIGRREASLAENVPINEKTLKQARHELAAPYREVVELTADTPLSKPPFKNPAETLKELQETRAKSKDWWNYYGREGRPSAKDRAIKFDEKAELLEEHLDAVAQQSGKPDLVARLRDARQKLAKNYDVEAAYNVGDGTLDARVWGRMLDRKKPLSGGLETAARFAEAHGDLVSPTNAAKAGAGLTKADKIWATLGAIGGGAMAGPMGLTAGLLPVANHLTRPFMLGKAAGKTATPSTTLRGLNAITELPAEVLPAESGNVRLRDLRPQ